MKALRTRLSYANIASTIALVVALAGGSLAMAHGVNHALFAHNAGKLDGLDSADYQKKCRNGSVLAFARVNISAVNGDSLSSDGITDAYNCKQPSNPALVVKGATGSSYIRFPGLMRGEWMTKQYVVTGNVEGLLHSIAFVRNGFGDDPVIQAHTIRIDTHAATDVSYSVALLKVKG